MKHAERVSSPTVREGLQQCLLMKSGMLRTAGRRLRRRSKLKLELKLIVFEFKL